MGGVGQQLFEVERQSGGTGATAGATAGAGCGVGISLVDRNPDEFGIAGGGLHKIGRTRDHAQIIVTLTGFRIVPIEHFQAEFIVRI